VELSQHMVRKEKQNTAIHVTRTSMICEIVLTFVKIIAGVLGRSQAMISDAIHSGSDLVSTAAVMIGIKLSGKEADEKHPYGYERMESVASVLLSLCLAITGAGIGYSGLKTIISGAYQNMEPPEMIALVAAGGSILFKEFLYWFLRHYAIKLNSSILMADAWHHRSDVLASIGTLVGIYGAQHGVLILEPIASVLISCCILKVAITVFKDAINEMIDCRGEQQIEEEIRSLVEQHKEVIAIGLLNSRKFGMKLYVDLDVYVDYHLSLNEANLIAIELHDLIEENIPVVKHVIVRTLPIGIPELEAE